MRESKHFERLAVLVAGGHSVKNAAKTIGCSAQTGWNHSCQPVFQARVAEVRSAMTDEAVGRLSTAATLAASTLVQLLDETQEPSIRMGAAKAILLQLVPVSEFSELRRRLDVLENSKLRIHQ